MTYLGKMSDLSKSIINLHGITLNEAKSKSRRPDILLARIEIVKKLRSEGYSLPMIGRFLNKHHTSIIYYTKQKSIDRPYKPVIDKNPQIQDWEFWA